MKECSNNRIACRVFRTRKYKRLIFHLLPPAFTVLHANFNKFQLLFNWKIANVSGKVLWFFGQDFKQILESCAKIWVHPWKFANLRMIFWSDFIWTKMKFHVANRKFLIWKLLAAKLMIFDDIQFATRMCHCCFCVSWYWSYHYIKFCRAPLIPGRKMCGSRKYPYPLPPPPPPFYRVRKFTQKIISEAQSWQSPLCSSRKYPLPSPPPPPPPTEGIWLLTPTPLRCMLQLNESKCLSTVAQNTGS